MKYQDRYLAYASANNKTADEMKIHDQKLYPGSCMVGYIFWINEKLREFKKKSPTAFAGDSLLDQAGFTIFLKENEAL